MTPDSPARAIPRTNVLGVGVSAVDMRLAVETLAGWVERREPSYVCVRDVHGVMASQRDEELRRIHNRAGMVTPDGMPLVWLSRWAGHRSVRRVYGPDLMLAACEFGLGRGWRHFLYGSSTETLELLARRLTDRFPSIQIADTFSPPFRPLTATEKLEVAERIRASASDLVWVGLSTPKQERWMSENVGRVGAPVLLGVGAAFDFHAGVKPQAPRWMQRGGLEWLFRLATEPRRLGGRYLRSLPLFVVLALAQRLGLLRRELTS